MEPRSIYQEMWQELSRHKPMVLLAGPRQVGKTTLARIIAKGFANSLYFNFDIFDDKRKLVDDPSFYERVDRKDSSRPLIIFDEIHKYRGWKNYLKGVYDRDSEGYRFLVSGSGRMDIFRRGGDSLAGRYLLFHLWPFTLAELTGSPRVLEDFLRSPLEIPATKEKEARTTWDHLGRFGGFPEPFLKGSPAFTRIWSRSYKERIIREDIRDLVNLQKSDMMAILLALLPSRVGSPISMDNLAMDIGVSFDSIKSWLEIFEHFYLIFRIAPWTRKVSRAIRKEKKLYFLDAAQVDSDAARFENLVAVELHRAVRSWTDRGWGDFSLHYVRNKEKEEVDFLLADAGRPLLIIEAKKSDDEPAPAPALRKMQLLLEVPAVQVVDRPGICRIVSNGPHKILVISAERWLAVLP